MRALVKWYRPALGLGRIVLENGQDAHVSRQAFVAPRTSLEPGEWVEVDVMDGPRAPVATRVEGRGTEGSKPQSGPDAR